MSQYHDKIKNENNELRQPESFIYDTTVNDQSVKEKMHQEKARL